MSNETVRPYCRIAKLVFSVALVSGLVAVLPARAGLVSFAHVSDPASDDGLKRDEGTLDGGRSTASVSANGTASMASAQYGILKAFSTSSIGSGAAASSYVQAEFSDKLTLSNEALNGQRGYLTFAYRIEHDAGVSATGDGWSNGNVSFLSRSGHTHSWYLHQYSTWASEWTMHEYRNPDSPSVRNDGVPRMSVLYHTAEFTWGHPLEIELLLSIAAGSGANDGTAGWRFDAGHSAYWAGIQSVVTGGAAVTDYSVASESGTDYSRSFVPAEIPEPATPAILLLGMVLMGVQRMRGQRPVDRHVGRQALAQLTAGERPSR